MSKKGSETPLRDIVSHLLERIDYKSHLQNEGNITIDERWSNIQELVRIADEHWENYQFLLCFFLFFCFLFLYFF